MLCWNFVFLDNNTDNYPTSWYLQNSLSFWSYLGMYFLVSAFLKYLQTFIQTLGWCALWTKEIYWSKKLMFIYIKWKYFCFWFAEIQNIVLKITRIILIWANYNTVRLHVRGNLKQGCSQANHWKIQRSTSINKKQKSTIWNIHSIILLPTQIRTFRDQKKVFWE